MTAEPDPRTRALAAVTGPLWRAWGRSRELGSDLLRSPDHRALRWILLVGLAVRFVLAPLTQWGGDTTYFAFSETNLFYAGNPYRADTLFNPPLGPIVELPGLAVLSAFVAPQQLIQYVPALIPVVTKTGMFTPYLPSSAYLLVLKLPLILADGVVAVLLYRLLRRDGHARWATVAAGAWLLNPLVIWASSVHAEVDGLAALAVVGFLYCWRVGSPLGAGIAVGLGAAAKLYPALLVPLALALFAGRLASAEERRRALLFLAGVGLAVVPILPYLPALLAVLPGQAGAPRFGGLSVLILLNTGLDAQAASLPPMLPSLIVLIAELTLPVTLGLAVYTVVRRPDRFAREDPLALARVALLSTAVVAAALIAYLAPQAENLIALIPPLCLALPRLGRRAFLAVGLVSAFAWAQYLSLLGPLAFFYPLARLLGPSALTALDSATIAYASRPGVFSRGSLWLILGVAAGLVILVVWSGTLYATAVEARRTPSRSTASDQSRGIAPDSPAPRPVSVARATRRPRAALGSTASVLAVLTIVVVGAAGGLAATRASAPLYRATVVSVVNGSGGLTASVEISVGAAPMHAHVGLVPGSRWPDGPIFFFDDPSFPSDYASGSDVHTAPERVAVALSSAGDHEPVQTVDAAGLPSLLATPPPGTLVVVGGVLPDTVLATNSSILAQWIAAGGTLVWAGGPLGYHEGHARPDGSFAPDSLRWQGQVDLAGFPVTDVGPTGAPTGSVPSPPASALGLEYNGTSTGANATRIALHGGTVLGWLASPEQAGESPRASLVSIPVGSGRILFFGGAYSTDAKPKQFVPVAELTLTYDIALLLATGFMPHGGGGAWVDEELGAGADRLVSVSGPVGGSQALVLVSAPPLPVYFAPFFEYVAIGASAAAASPTTVATG